MKKYNCPVCTKEVFSGTGKGCKLCGMLLETKEGEFCCNNCKRTYNNLHHTKK